MPQIIRPYEPYIHLGPNKASALIGEAENFFKKFPGCTLKTSHGSVSSFVELQTWLSENTDVVVYKPDELMDILNDKETQFIWAVRALRGSMGEDDRKDAKDLEIYIKKEFSTKVFSGDFVAKPMMGYCGSLAAMLPLESLGLVIPVHGPFGTMWALKEGEVKRINDLFSQGNTGATIDIGKLEPMNPAAEKTKSIEGYVYGGIINFLKEVLNDPSTQLKNAILFTEIPGPHDIAECCSAILQAYQAGKFTVKAFIFGDVKSNDEINAQVNKFMEIVQYHHVPVFAGLPVGHFGAFKDNIPVPFGWATLKVEDTGASFTYDWGKTQEILRAKRNNRIKIP